MDTIKSALTSLGLGSPLNRGLAAFILTEVLTILIKPGFAYNPDGSPKKWAALSSGQNTTWFPFWIVGIVAFIVVSAI